MLLKCKKRLLKIGLLTVAIMKIMTYISYMKKPKALPKFKNEDEEREFWAKHSPLDFPQSFRPVNQDFSNLKRSSRSVTLRMPESLSAQIKIAANKRDVPYQSLMKVFLSEKMKDEHASKHVRS
jgi:predicted DNA binding CopG/RHH family protein